MALNYVTLTLDLYDGQGNPVTKGTASFTPSVQLTDAGVELVPQVPIPAVFHAAGTPAVKLLATDNAAPLPNGWLWNVTFSGVPGNPAAFSFFLPFSGGSAQTLSSVVPVSSVPAVHLPLRLIYADLYGADPTGTNDSTAALLAAQAAGGGGAYQIVLSAGTYIVGTSQDLGVFGRNQGMTGQGRGVTTLRYKGTGTCVAAFDSSFSSSASVGGKFGGFTIDGTTAGTGAVGMSWGNLQVARCHDINIASFSSTGAVGLKFANSGVGAHSEQGEWTAVKLSGNTVGVLWDTNSFDYSVYQFLISANANQDGMRLQNDASLEGCRLEIRGNFNSGVTNTGSVISIDPGNAPGTSRIDSCQIYVNVECDGATGTGHFTLSMAGGSSSQFTGTGALIFNDETVSFQGANFTLGTQQFGFSGLVIDHVLGKMTPSDAAVFHGGTQWAERGALSTVFSGNIFLQFGDVIALKLASGANSLTFNGHLERSRRIEMYIAQPSSGGAGTMTWPSNVFFPGGNPALSTVNGSVDRVRLTYLPSESNWYGEAVTGYVANTAGTAPPLIRGGMFGDGTDGTVTLDGAATVSWAALNSNIYTMSRDAQVKGLTVNAGVTLKPAGYRVFCQGTVTNGGTIDATGNPGLAAGTAGAHTTNGALQGGLAGGAGNTGAGSAGTSGSSAGTGNAGAGGAGTGGAAGAAGTMGSSSLTFFHTPGAALTGVLNVLANVTALTGAPGGGGGSGDTSNKGGGGGSGGGPVVIFAWFIVNTGAITAPGGAGGTPATGNCGGGGGGAGGPVLLYTLAAWSNSGTTSVAGGALGSGVGTGTNGSAGSAGNVLNVVLQ